MGHLYHVQRCYTCTALLVLCDLLSTIFAWPIYCAALKALRVIELTDSLYSVITVIRDIWGTRSQHKGCEGRWVTAGLYSVIRVMKAIEVA
jgi:hypothetical protein